MYLGQWNHVLCMKYCFIIKILFSVMYLRPRFSTLFRVVCILKILICRSIFCYNNILVLETSIID